jgi:PncC family amidohydrolase
MSIESQVDALAKVLAEKRLKVIFAESCTAGLVSASLARVPGISDYLCGSAVVYRESTKLAWLSVSPSDLERFTAVSEPVASQMALGALDKTPEADVAAAVTGHLGPNAPEGFDGVVFVAVAQRQGDCCRILGVWRHLLQNHTRRQRQREATELVLHRLICELETFD